MPYKTATNSQTGEKLIQVDGSWQKLEKSATDPKTGAKAYQVGGKWLTDTAGQPSPGAEKPKQKTGLFGDPNPMPSPMTEAISEPFMKMVTGAGATAVGGLRSLAGAIGGDPNSADKGQAVAQKLTYEPKSQVGQAVSAAVEYPGTKLAEGADVIGRNVAEVTHSPALGAAANTMTQTAAQVLLGKGAGLASKAAGIEGVTSAAETAEATRATALKEAPNVAKQYVESKAGLKWDELPAGIKGKITTIARDPEALKKLTPKIIQREARAENLKMPLTRGDAERKSSQLSKEERISKIEGNPVAEIRQKQDEALHGRLDELQKATGSKVETREQVGKSVQDTALRGKAKVSKENYDRLYAQARATEPNAAVSPEPFYEALQKDPDIQHLSWMQSWLNKARAKGTATEGVDLSTDIGKAKSQQGTPLGEKVEFRPLKLNELDDLRKKASKVVKGGGEDAYYAGEVLKAIDRAFDTIPAGAKAWRAARDAFKAHKAEFQDQRAVKALTVNTKGTKDRAVGLEDTTENILKKSKEDIGKIRQSLLTGGTEQTRAAGATAWKDLQAGVIDYLREKASGRRGLQGEGDARPEFQPTFIDAFRELDKNGKIDAIFDKPTAAKLRELYEGARDVRTKPSKRISGSDTVANQRAENTLTALEKVSQLKGGPLLAGAVKKARSILEAGKQTREAARAKTTPTTEAAENATKQTKKADKKARRSRNTLRSLRRAGKAAPLTLQDQDQQRQP